MDGSVVRLEHPNLPQKKKPQVNTYKQRDKQTYKMRKEHAPDTILPRPPQKPLTEEQYAKSKIRIAATIRKKYKKPRFYSDQLRHSTAYKDKYLYDKTKVCTMCGKERGLGAFDLTGDAREVKQAHRSYCRFCKKKANKIYYLKRKKRLNDDNLRKICTGTGIQTPQKEGTEEG